MKWRDVINGLNKADDELLNSECGNNVITRLAMKYMTQDELWSHHDDTDPKIRYVVAQKIIDQDKLWSMRDDRYTTVKGAVARRIKDQDRLVELGAGGEALEASRRIKDLGVLVKMAAGAVDATYLAVAIIRRLKGNPARLREIASLTTSPLIKVRVAVALNDQEYLWSLRNDLDCRYRHDAVEAFAINIEGDDRMLEFIRIGDERNYGYNIRWQVAERIKDQDKLWGLYRSDTGHLANRVAPLIEDEDKLWSMQFDPMTAYDVIQVKRTIALRITSVERLMILIGDEDQTVSDRAKVRLDEVMRGHKEETV